MFDDVVVFAHSYPYWTGPTAETYLESELRRISSHCKRLHVIAFENVWDGAPLRQGVPDNLRAIRVADETLPLDRGWRRRLFQLKALIGKELLFDLGKLNSRSKLIEYTYFIRRSNRLASIAWNALRDQCPSFGHGRTLIYSFWFNEPARAAILLAGKMKKAGLPRPAVLARTHGYDCYAYRSALGYLPGQTWMALNLDKVLPCSCDGAAYLDSLNPRAKGKFQVLHLGTEDHGLGPNPDAGGDSGMAIVTCSRVVPLKRLDAVARALGVLKRRGIAFKWICIGDGESMGDLRSQVISLGLNDCVSFTGALTQLEIVDFYQQTPVDVFVNASEYEGIPLAIMEAFSYGIPAVATEVGGNPEIVETGITGKLVSKDCSDEDLADAIIAVAGDRSSEYRQAARRKWENEFSASTNSAKLIKIGDSILGE